MILNILFFLLNLFLGIIPSFVFFAWMERNCDFSFFTSKLPLHNFNWGSLFHIFIWNAGLFSIFAFSHTFMAQTKSYAYLERFLPQKYLRSVYMMVTGLSCLLIITFWQPTGIELWSLGLSPLYSHILSITLFWACLIACGFIVEKFGSSLHFVGISQIFESSSKTQRAEGSPTLVTQGIFSFVRHPVYFLTLVGLLLTPVMTLDRLMVILFIIVYLKIGIPIEEKKLIALFGNAYSDYQKKVPAVFPFLWP